MGIQDLKGYDALEALGNLAEPIFEIAQDEDIMTALREGGKENMLQRVAVIVPRLLKGHGEALVQLLAAYKGQPAEEYAEAMTVKTIMADAYNLMSDEELLSFLG